MTKSDEDVVWEITADNGTWACKVVRTAGYSGILTLTRVKDGKVILTEDVGLSYGAVFGPDVMDVTEWENTCIKAIDAQAKESS